MAAAQPTDVEAAKSDALDGVTRWRDRLVDASQHIWAHPELGFEEHEAAGTLTELLTAGGLDVEQGAYGLDTSFAARAGSGDGPHVVICCEYDALPGIGHACGHNIIGTAGVGAALALAPLVDRLGGRLTVLGTPAEELGAGGKIRLLERGAFEGVDVAMMVHPSIGDVPWAPHIATTRLHCTMHGKAAHAAAAPWEGINALDGIVLAYQAVGALRQHLREGEKVHGIITHGGDAENIVPERAAATFQVRARDEAALEPFTAKVLACFEGAARQTGCRLDVEHGGHYAELRWNRTLSDVFLANQERVGRPCPIDPARIPLSVAGSTDMGNVSQAVPTLHPMIRIAPLDVAGHSVEFAECARSPEGDAAVADGAAELALTAVDLWATAQLVRDAWEEHRRTA